MEQDILTVRVAIKAAEGEHAVARAAADKVRADMRASEVDFTTHAEAFTRLDEAYKIADAKRDEIAELRTREARLIEITGERADEIKPTIERGEARTIAARLMESPQFRALRESKVLESGTSRVNMDPAELYTRDGLKDLLRTRTTVDNTAGSGGGRIWSDRLESLLVNIPVRAIRLLDVVTVGDTDSDTIEWANETTLTDAAAETPYGTAAPESAYGYTKASVTVKRIPAFVPATKGALNDSGQLQTLLSSRLSRGVQLRLESQMQAGNATGENLEGIATVAGTSTQAKAADSYFDSVHKAITKIRLAYFQDPVSIGIHPTDFESILLEKDANGNYVHGRAASEGTVQTIWGLTPIVSPLFTQGTAWVADYSEAYLWIRQGLMLSASDQHQDFFIKGLVALLAEMRVAFKVIQPKAFCSLTGL